MKKINQLIRKFGGARVDSEFYCHSQLCSKSAIFSKPSLSVVPNKVLKSVKDTHFVVCYFPSKQTAST